MVLSEWWLQLLDPRLTGNGQPFCHVPQAAPYDFLQADEVLSENQIQDTRALASVWTADGMYALLPRSSIILEAVPVEATVAQPAAQQKVKASNPAVVAGSKAPAM